MSTASSPTPKSQDTRDFTRELLKTNNFTANESNVIKALFLRASLTGELWMSREEIIQLTSLKKSSVSAAIASLEKSGAIEVTRRNQVSSQNPLPNLYKINWGHVHDTDMAGPGDGHGGSPQDGPGQVHEVALKEPLEEPTTKKQTKKRVVVKDSNTSIATPVRKVRRKKVGTSSRRFSSESVHQVTTGAGPSHGHDLKTAKNWLKKNLTVVEASEPKTRWDQEFWND